MKFFKLITLNLMSIALCSCINLKNRSLSEFDLKSISFDQDTHDCVILGGGVGGLASSVYTSMAGYETLVIQGEAPGGLITQSVKVENWPGEIAISGQELASKIRTQALSHNVKIEQGKVIGVDFKKWPYSIFLKNLETDKTTEIKALSCIITMGTRPNLLKIPGESGKDGYFGRGVSTCAICDGSIYKNKTVAVIGGGDAAASEAVYLSKLAKKVYLIARGESLRANFALQEQLKNSANIQIILETKATKINGDGQKVTSISTLNLKDNTPKDITIDGVFLAIGATPNTTVLKDQIELNEDGYIKLFSDQETSRKGIFTAGDISDSKFKQAITAAGDSVKAALQVIDFLQCIGYSPKPTDSTETRAPKPIEQNKTSEQKNNVIIDINNENQFKQILNKNEIVVADFYGTFCIPCQQMHPIFEKVASDLGNSVKFVKINVDKNGSLTRAYSISSVPAFIVFKNGKKVGKFTGSRSYESLKKEINTAIK